MDQSQLASDFHLNQQQPSLTSRVFARVVLVLWLYAANTLAMQSGTTAAASSTASPSATAIVTASSTTSTLYSEGWDFAFAAASLLIGIGAIVIALIIFTRQRRDSKLLQEKIFGTLPNVESVNQKMVELLELAENSPESTVSLMVYWAWFGADLKYPEIDIPSLNYDHSRVAQLLHARFSKNLETNLVMFEPGERLKQFVYAVLNYRALQRRKHAIEIQGSDVDALLDRYERNVQILSQHQQQRRQGKENNEGARAEMLRVQEVPNLLFAVRGGGVEAGIIYLGEISTLEKNTQTGGFYTEDPRMVNILRQQITAYGGSDAPIQSDVIAEADTSDVTPKA